MTPSPALKVTPGEWSVNANGTFVLAVEQDGLRRTVASVHGGEMILGSHVTSDEQRANCHMLAQSKRLYEALERQRQGLANLLEFRRLENGRFGNLTREEIEESMHGIDFALALARGERV